MDKWALKTKYGITPKYYEELLLWQNGICAICKEACPTGNRLAVDHDHETKQVRGLLCVRCNLLIGCAKDSMDILQAAINYLSITDRYEPKIIEETKEDMIKKTIIEVLSSEYGIMQKDLVRKVQKILGKFGIAEIEKHIHSLVSNNKITYCNGDRKAKLYFLC